MATQVIPHRIVIRAIVLRAPILSSSRLLGTSKEIAEKEDARAQPVDGLAELEVAQHLQLRKADIHAVDPCQDPQDHQKRDQPPGNLAVCRIEWGGRRLCRYEGR